MSGNTKELIKKYNLRLTKSLGQNFLNDENVVRNIVESAGVTENDIVIEVGPGAGSMTEELAKRAGVVIAVEIDKHLIPVLHDRFKDSGNVHIMNEDIMRIDLKQLVTESISRLGTRNEKTVIKVVANLPYYITTPIIMKFLEEEPGLDTMVFMVQREVADRMIASPGGKDYGALSVAVQFYSKAERVLNVPPHCFIPQPEVESTVVRLSVYKEPQVDVKDKGIFFKVVKAAFGQRRKTLLNALANAGYFIQTKDEIKDILKEKGIGETQRGETLSIQQFAALSNAFSLKNS